MPLHSYNGLDLASYLRISDRRFIAKSFEAIAKCPVVGSLKTVALITVGG
jgi:hypothetical protein